MSKIESRTDRMDESYPLLKTSTKDKVSYYQRKSFIYYDEIYNVDSMISGRTQESIHFLLNHDLSFAYLVIP